MRYAKQPSEPRRKFEGMTWLNTATGEKKRWRGGKWVGFRRCAHAGREWTETDIKRLRKLYPSLGQIETAKRMNRTKAAIAGRAHLLGLEAHVIINPPIVTPEQVDQGIALVECGMGVETAAREIGCTPASFTNAYHIEVGRRRGTIPAPRDRLGGLLPEGVERIREHLRNGAFGWQIMQDCQVSAGCVSEQRRRYAKELAKARKPKLPPPGGGIAYSGVKVPAAKRQAVEQLFLDGFGTLQAFRKTGVSKTVCVRIRAALIRRLKRQGRCLPGCDENGVRRLIKESPAHIHPRQKADLRELLLEGVPVTAAAKIVGMGGSKAYEERDRLKTELAAIGEELPPPRRMGRHAFPVGPGTLKQAKAWTIAKPTVEAIVAIARVIHEQHEQAETRRILEEAAAKRLAAEERRREVAAAEEQRMRLMDMAIARAAQERPTWRPQPKPEKKKLSFEEQLAAVERGEARIVRKIEIHKPLPEQTLGGISSAML